MDNGEWKINFQLSILEFYIIKMYAIIATQGHQYIVQEWLELTVDKIIDAKEGDTVTFDNVLCTFDKEGTKVTVGKPSIKGAKVTAKVVSIGKGDKMRVLKFQGKKRYKRVKWFRPHQTVITIDKIAA